MAAAIRAGVIRDESDAKALQRREFLFHEHIDSVQHRRLRGRLFRRGTARLQRVRDVAEIEIRNRLRRERRELLVDRGIHPADEEAGNGGDAIDGLTGGLGDSAEKK